MRLPRRLGHDEAAGLVEHLGELRARLVVILVALAAGFAVAYGFHHQLIDWLNQALPAHHRKPVTLGVTEPFMTSLKISLYAGFAIALPVILWQVWSFLAPAVRRVRRVRHPAIRGRGRFRPPDRTSGRRPLPHQLRLRGLRHPDPRLELLLVRAALDPRRRNRLRASGLHSRARSIPRPLRGEASPKPSHRLRRDGCACRSAARRRSRHDRVRDGAPDDPVRRIDLACSDLRAALAERAQHRAHPRERLIRGLRCARASSRTTQ